MCTNMHKDLENRFPNYGAKEKIYAYTHLLHPGQKGTILYQLGLYNSTCESFVLDEEGAPPEVAVLDEAVDADSDDEEQAMLIRASQGMSDVIPVELTPMGKELAAYRSSGLLPGKNLDVLAYWKNHEKQFPLLAKVIRGY